MSGGEIPVIAGEEAKTTTTTQVVVANGNGAKAKPIDEFEEQDLLSEEQHSEKRQKDTKKAILSRNRLLVPEKNTLATKTGSGSWQGPQDQQPLVLLDSDSDDEFATPKLSPAAHREITQQLIRDGYNLDLEPDDEDLDLIPPRPLHQRPCNACSVCGNYCAIL